MKKRLLKNLMLVMVMTILCFTVAMTASAETYTGECGLEGDNLTWTFDTETGVLTIDGEGEMDNYALYNNINKTSAPWWDYYSSMTELVIGNEVASIGDYAFYNCDTLTSIEIPENIETIGDYAFYDCNNIVDVNFKEGLVSIGAYTFYQCDNIKEVIIPDSVTEIGTYSFAYCENIENIKFGNGLIKIPSQAFAYCKKLNNIEWGTNLKTISSFAFAYCHQNGGEVGYNCGSIVIPCGVERIDRSAFSISESRKNTSSVSIPLSVKYIGENAFGSFSGEITNVYYEGTIEQWEEIDIYSYSNSNENLRNATIHFGHTHSYTSEITTEPTCLTTGIETYTCECGESYTRTLSDLGHDIVIDSAVSETCTETGLTEGEHCLRCDYKIEQEETPVLGHDEVIIPAVNATCTATGLTEGLVCSRCDTVFTAQEETPMIDHNIVITPAVAPTCTSTGLTEGKYCSECGTVFESREEVSELGHSDIDNDGKCDNCSVSLTDEPEQPKENNSFFSLIMNLINKILDFLRKLFSIK